jgi:hypothetical protein
MEREMQDSVNLTSAPSEGEPGDALAPCPLCGGPMSWCGDVVTEDEPEGHTCHHLRCVPCGYNVDFNGKQFDVADTMEQLRALVFAAWNRRAPAVPPNWKDIATAPKDGTWILLCQATGADGEPIESESFGLFVQRAAWWKGDGWIDYCSMTRDPSVFFKPTHWMPLPPPPEAASQPDSVKGEDE